MSIMQSGFVEVKLTRGLVTIIDAEDLELVSQWKWCAQRSGNTNYAQRTDYSHGKQLVILHRVLVNAPIGIEVDHENGNGLDNRKENLRLCTRSQNSMNKRKRKGCSSDYKGVSKFNDGRRKPWNVVITVDYQRHTRSFPTEIEAALWYDEMAREHFGEFAKLNFP